MPIVGERDPRQQAQSPAGVPRSAGFFVRAALTSDIDPIKIIADDSRAELGFHTRDSFTEGVDRGEILVAVSSGAVAGFVRFHHTRAGHTTLREVATARAFRGRGIGRLLVLALLQQAREAGAGSI